MQETKGTNHEGRISHNWRAGFAYFRRICFPVCKGTDQAFVIAVARCWVFACDRAHTRRGSFPSRPGDELGASEQPWPLS